MTLQLRTVGTLSKSLAVRREQRDDKAEVVVCTLGVTGCVSCCARRRTGCASCAISAQEPKS